MNYQKAYPVLVPTDKPAQPGDMVLNTPNKDLYIMSRRDNRGNFDVIHVQGSTFYEWDRAMPAQHLHILSDEEIKEGDLALNLFENSHTIFRITKVDVDGYTGQKLGNEYGFYGLGKTLKKIIASTDRALLITKTTQDDVEALSYKTDVPLPRPSDEFIKLYCEKGGIDEVLVEMRAYNRSTTWEYDEPEVIKLKVKPDNTIVIKPVVDGRIIRAAHKMMNMVAAKGQTYGDLQNQFIKIMEAEFEIKPLIEEFYKKEDVLNYLTEIGEGYTRNAISLNLITYTK